MYINDKIKEGEAFFTEGKIQDAIAVFETVVSKEPLNFEALNNLGVIYHTLGEDQDAEQCFKKASAANNDYLDPLYNLADLYQNENRWEEASEYLNRCLVLDGTDPNLFNRLGMVYLEMGRSDKAKNVLARSLEINPDQAIVQESFEKLNHIRKTAIKLPKPGTFKASFEEIDITPDVSESNPVYLQGYSGPSRGATTIFKPLKMQLLLLEDDHFTKLLFVTADIFGFGPEIVNPVCACAASWGIEPEGIILNASHTHHGPGTIAHAGKDIGPFNGEYTSQIGQLIIQQFHQLYNNLETCQISWGKIDTQIGISRRLKKDNKILFAPNGNGYYFKHTPFLVVHLKDCDQKVILVNHGCHPTGMGMELVISSDFPAYTRDALVNSGIVDAAMFLQGGGGSTKESIDIDNDISFCKSIAGVKANGELLANKIIKKIKQGLQTVEGSFSGTRKQFSLPLKPLPEPFTIGQIRNNPEAIPLVREWADHLLNHFPEGNYPNSVPMEIQLLTMGNHLSFITLPGEPVAELARELINTTNHPDSTFLLGYTNGLIGYLPTDQMIREGGYETEFSPFVYQAPSAFAQGTESAIVSAANHCVDEPAKHGETNGYGRYHLAKSEKKAFFALSAGRCGTMTLAHLLDTANNAKVWHHPQPDPIMETLLAYWGDLDRQQVFWKARYSIIHKTWAEGFIHGETDLLMTPFCDMIAEEIPDSKFIILVRDPKDFVRSGMRRNYYLGHPWDFGRLRPREGNNEYEAWQNRDQFEKICWLWRETYKRILQIKEQIPQERVLVVKFEDLVASDSISEDIFDFLGLKGFNEQQTNQVLLKKLNAQPLGDYPEPEFWNNELLKSLWDECGKVADYFGYKMPDALTKNASNRRSVSIVSQKHENAQNRRLLFLEHTKTSTGGHLDHVVSHFQQTDHVKYVKTSNQDEVKDLIQWADIVWLEWANQMAVYVTLEIPEIKEKRVICRLNGYEVFTDLPAQINWSVVDHLVFGARHKQNIFNQKFKIQSPPQSIIRYGIDTDKYSICENKQNTKRLVLIGHLNYRKGLPLLLQFYHELLKYDPDYYLFIRGEFQDLRLEMAVHTMIKELELTNKLEFVDWIDDLDLWLADKSHILSFSLEESFHYAIGNGMAAGLKPIIHAWHESREIWPDEFIFRDLSEFLKLILKVGYEPQRYRDWVIENRSKDHQIKMIENLFEDLLENKRPSRNEALIYPKSFQKKTLLKDPDQTPIQPHCEHSLSYEDIKAYYNKRYFEKQEHTMRPERYYHIFLDHLKIQRGGRLLDVSCGTGYLVKLANQRGLNAHGIDISFEAIKISRRVVNKDCLLNSLGEALPFKDEQFDYLTCLGSLEHFLDMDKGLAEFKRVLKHDGKACLVVPNENFIGWTSNPQKGTAQQEMNEHLDTLDGWKRLLSRNGFDITHLFQDNAACPNINVPDELCYQFVFICNKSKTLISADRKEPPSSHRPLTKNLQICVDGCKENDEYNGRMKEAEIVNPDLVELIDDFIPYDKKHVEAFLHSPSIQPVSIKAEGIGDDRLSIDLLLRNKEGAQLFVQNISYTPPNSIHCNNAYEPLVDELNRILSGLEIESVRPEQNMNWVFDDKLKTQIQENQADYIWERPYPGTGFMNLKGSAVIARRYRFAEGFITNKVVLDAASGFGYGAAFLRRTAKLIVALDIAEENVEFGDQTYPFDNIIWKKGDVTQLPFSDGSFDAYVSLETMEHLPHDLIPIYIEEAVRVIQPNGIFIVSTPNRKVRENRVNNPYHLSEMYFEQFQDYLQKSFSALEFYSTKGWGIFKDADPSRACGFIAVCRNSRP